MISGKKDCRAALGAGSIFTVQNNIEQIKVLWYVRFMRKESAVKKPVAKKIKKKEPTKKPAIKKEPEQKLPAFPELPPEPKKVMVYCMLPGAEEAEPVEITEKEDVFCREYIADAGENQTRAFIRAYKGEYTYESARVMASKLFAKVNIQARIKELRAERCKRLEITADRVLAELAKLAFYDPKEFFDADMRLKPLNELDPDQAAVIAGIETFHKIVGEDKDGVTVLTKIKLPDKGANLERLGKHLELFTDRTKHMNPDGSAFVFNFQLVPGPVKE